MMAVIVATGEEIADALGRAWSQCPSVSPVVGQSCGKGCCITIHSFPSLHAPSARSCCSVRDGLRICSETTSAGDQEGAHWKCSGVGARVVRIAAASGCAALDRRYGNCYLLLRVRCRLAAVGWRDSEADV